MNNKKFLVEIIHASSRFIVRDLDVEVSPDDEMKFLAAISPDDQNIAEDKYYDISADALAALQHDMGIMPDIVIPDDCYMECRLSGPNDYPYQLHTGRELKLMLEGVKPMSMFYETLPRDAGLGLIPEAYFEPYVQSGQLLRREYHGHRESADWIRIVYFATANQAWRIDAHILLRETSKKTGWNSTLERLEGTLLGYKDWQNDWHINARYRNSK